MRHLAGFWAVVVMVGGLAGVLGCGGKDAPPSMEQDAGVDASEVDCPPGEPPLDPELLPECDFCPDARCVPNFALEEDQIAMLAPCSDSSTCVPELFIETNGQFLLTRCTSLNGAEGRCLSPCIPAVSSQADLLPADVCTDGWLCAPCYDPLTGEDTGACRQSCDPGPTEEPVVFTECCGGLGSCVPESLVSEEQAAQLGVDTCTGDGVLCAPKDLADPTYTPPRCDSVGGVEGRCLPECLPDIQAQASLLPQSTCDAGHLCAPCYDPTTGEDTGACRLNGDEPEDEPVTFAPCCSDRGVCVPEDAVPEEQQDQLGPDTCVDEGYLCAPTVLTSSTYIPPSCRSVADVEGRCLPDCLPDVAAQADLLPQSTCDEGDLCVPCYDPTDGSDTGACRLNGDEPVEEPTQFERCCSDRGMCVPPSLVPDEQQDQLGPDTCSDGTMLCAPDDLADPSYIPPTCSSVAGAEGRCLPDCLPAIDAQSHLLPRDICDEGDLCAPCYDPVTGVATGACSINGDEPAEPPVTFDRCCSDRGACVPSELVPPEQQAQLGQDTCTGNDELCAPDNLIDSTYTPPFCESIGGGEGRCLPDCLPAIQEQADMLPRSTCDEGDLCAPCYDPITGEDTGACRINGDAPTQPPYTFPECCDGISLCIPSYLVPEDQQQHLDGEGCSDPDSLCVPKVFVEDPNYQPEACVSRTLADLCVFGGSPGVCLPECLPALRDISWALCSGSCSSGWTCAPCEDPLSGEPTGACDI
jgi:hypothetical protein